MLFSYPLLFFALFSGPSVLAAPLRSGPATEVYNPLSRFPDLMPLTHVQPEIVTLLTGDWKALPCRLELVCVFRTMHHVFISRSSQMEGIVIHQDSPPDDMVNIGLLKFVVNILLSTCSGTDCSPLGL